MIKKNAKPGIYVLLILGCIITLFFGGFIKNIYKIIPKELGGGRISLVCIKIDNEKYDIKDNENIYFIDKNDGQYYFKKIENDEILVIPEISIISIREIDGFHD
jgi:hypothetical protein